MAAFIAFGTTVYKYAGGAIAKSLDERQEVRGVDVAGLLCCSCACAECWMGGEVDGTQELLLLLLLLPGRREEGRSTKTPTTRNPPPPNQNQAIISEINRLEELELKLYKETIDAAELEKTIVVRAESLIYAWLFTAGWGRGMLLLALALAWAWSRCGSLTFPPPLQPPSSHVPHPKTQSKTDRRT